MRLLCGCAACLIAEGLGCCDWLPQGPISDQKLLKAEVHQATLSCHIGNGGFNSSGFGDVHATKAHQKQDAQQHGLQKRFVCITCRDLLEKEKAEWTGERAWTPSDSAVKSGTSAAANTKKAVHQHDLLWHCKYELADDGNFYLVSAQDEHFGSHDLNSDAARIW